MKTKRTYWTMVTEKQCIYPELRKWMNASNVCVCGLTRMLYGDGNENKRKTVVRALTGGNCSKKTIDSILEVSGLTYEDAFGKGR